MINTQDKRPIVLYDGFNNFIRNLVVNEAMNANGDLYGGALGVLRSIKNITKLFCPKLFVVVWEQGGPSPRRKSIYPEYKANRAKTSKEVLKEGFKTDREFLLHDEETKTKQLLFLIKALSNLPILQIYIPETEGDDIVGFLAKREFAQDPSDKIIVSNDKDFYQLLDDPKVKIYDTGKKILVTKETVEQNTGITPRNFALAKACCGDISDNIDGVPGIKFKTLSKRFPDFLDSNKDLTIKEVLDHAKVQLEQNPKKPLKCYQDVLESESIIRRNWQLIYLDTSVFSASQIEKIRYKVQEYSPKMDYLELLRCFSAVSLPITTETTQLTTDLKTLLK
jgi:5'-3' exonuclease